MARARADSRNEYSVFIAKLILIAQIANKQPLLIPYSRCIPQLRYCITRTHLLLSRRFCTHKYRVSILRSLPLLLRATATRSCVHSSFVAVAEEEARVARVFCCASKFNLKDESPVHEIYIEDAHVHFVCSVKLNLHSRDVPHVAMYIT